MRVGVGGVVCVCVWWQRRRAREGASLGARAPWPLRVDAICEAEEEEGDAAEGAARCCGA